MKVVCLFGSPRPKGNSTLIANRFCDKAEQLGAKVEKFSLNKLNYRGCQACMTCKTKLDKCVLKDDLSQVLDSIHDADILVLASPVYYGDVTSQMKAFVDRTFSYLVPDYTTNPNPSRLERGKKLVFIQVQGSAYENQFDDIFTRYEYFFKWYGFGDAHLIRGLGLFALQDAEKDEKILQLAEQTAQQLIGTK
jgi:multimeric flavodoxin WrbA